MRAKTRALIFVLAVAITTTVFVMIETVVFNEPLKRSIIQGLISGIACGIGMMLYLNHLKKKYMKDNK
ncbi:hypothetical protein HK413_10695 [Mucilaginibacter sp. S1162]|uniref:Uncharacterized protein n=1 Tax=Mucilaginibacter humi TaxID=2732510 RepID=A0ABX1W2L3_9SPHI|nr:hypothetical protein [Mucilaginibacter humi]NNU34467.1 hypothetical protein [Mucilaginibacter humi]